MIMYSKLFRLFGQIYSILRKKKKKKETKPHNNNNNNNQTMNVLLVAIDNWLQYSF